MQTGLYLKEWIDNVPTWTRSLITGLRAPGFTSANMPILPGFDSQPHVFKMDKRMSITAKLLVTKNSSQLSRENTVLQGLAGKLWKLANILQPCRMSIRLEAYATSEDLSSSELVSDFTMIKQTMRVLGNCVWTWVLYSWASFFLSFVYYNLHERPKPVFPSLLPHHQHLSKKLCYSKCILLTWMI